MKLLLDQLCVAAALGNTATVAFSTGGTAANDADFPTANLWNNTTPKEAMDLTVKYARYETLAAAADTVILTYDLIASRPVSHVLISGWLDENADTFGLGSKAGDIASIAVQYDIGSGWVTAATVTATAGDFYGLLTTPKIWIHFSEQTTNDWRIVITPIASPASGAAIRIGYVGFYDELAELPLYSGNGVQVIDPRVITDTVAGAPNIVDRATYQIIQAGGIVTETAATQMIDQLMRYTSRPTSAGTTAPQKMNPRILPCLALYVNELNDATTAGIIASQLHGGMVYAMPGASLSFPEVPSFKPITQYLFREHV